MPPTCSPADAGPDDADIDGAPPRDHVPHYAPQPLVGSQVGQRPLELRGRQHVVVGQEGGAQKAAQLLLADVQGTKVFVVSLPPAAAARIRVMMPLVG